MPLESFSAAVVGTGLDSAADSGFVSGLLLATVFLPPFFAAFLDADFFRPFRCTGFAGLSLASRVLSAAPAVACVSDTSFLLRFTFFGLDFDSSVGDLVSRGMDSAEACTAESV